MERNYTPQPVDLTNVELPSALMELAESIAKNVHDVWALNRMNEGWTYGQPRDDTQKKHPDLIPYEDLTDSEKAYDRHTALSTLKLIKALGFDIVAGEG